MMKRFVITISVMFVLLVTFAYSQPKIEIVGGNVYDWGNVTPKENPLKAKIKIKNTGNELLEIYRVKPTCGCTTAPISKEHLKPNETAELDVTLKITGASGNYIKHINVYSNDPKTGNKIIDLKAYVKRPLTLDPSTFIPLNGMQVGFSTTGSCLITNTSDVPITLSDVSVSPSNASVNLKNSVVLKPGDEFKLILKVTPNKAGAFRAKIDVKSSHPDFPLLTIYGYGSAQKSALFNN